MSATVKIGAAVCAAAMAVAGIAAPASAAKGRNNSNAKLCQKGGWQNLYTSAGDTYDSEKACTRYAAGGGTLTTTPPPPPHPYPGAKAACEALTGGSLTVINAPADGWDYVYWQCDWEGSGSYATLLSTCTAGSGTSFWFTYNPITIVWRGQCVAPSE